MMKTQGYRSGQHVEFGDLECSLEKIIQGIEEDLPLDNILTPRNITILTVLLLVSLIGEFMVS